LSDKQLFELAEIGVELETGFGYPQDVEWAIYEDKLYVLQSRPVTTV